MPLSLLAPGKINLTLRVLGRRDDGFHEIETLLSRIDLCDRLDDLGPGGGGPLLECDDPALPNDEHNLVIRAARLLAERTGTDCLRRFRLHKRIPVGAGLGGGSSDAAAALRLLCCAAELDVPRADLLCWAAELGSDVPFFLGPPAALARGRGERLEPVALRWPGWAVVLIPPLRCATAAVYSQWRPRAVPDERPIIPPALVGSAPADEAARQLFNDLEEPACRAYPELAIWKGRLGELSPRPLCLSGSGAAFFTLADTEHEVRDLAAHVARRAPAVTVAVTALALNTMLEVH